MKTLTEDDELYIFYAGHGFSKNGHNYITSHDTDPDDLEDTSIKLVIEAWRQEYNVRECKAVSNSLYILYI